MYPQNRLFLLIRFHSDGAGCAYDVHGIPYQRVCGKVIGYPDGSTDAFANYSIEDAYVDGVSLTHGHSPYHHIWTFASAVDKSDQYSTSGSICPCTKLGQYSIICGQ